MTSKAQETMILIYTLCGSQDEAETLARHLVTEKLAACVNIGAPVTSIYQWEEQIETATEIPLLVKSLSMMKDRVFTVVKEMHSYTVPVILSWEADSLNPAYTEWMKQCL